MINLSSGDNPITVTATDGAGNPGTDIITVTVIPPTPTLSPTPTPSPTTTPTPGIIVGAVVDALAVVPISGATVSTDRGGYAATTDAAGAYLMSNVSPGSYVLTASATGFDPSTQAITIEAGVPVVVNFALIPVLPTPTPSPTPSPGIVFGIVQDEDETPLKGVTVIIEGNNFSDNTETNEDGFFTFENVLSGNYTLTFEKEDYETQTMDIALGEGEVKDLGIITLEQVPPPPEIYGYVVNIKGNPIEFVRLRLKGIKTKVIKTASSDEDGFFEFTDLEVDTYIIFAKKKKYRNTQRKVKLGDSESKEIEIVMKKTSKRVKEMIEDGQE